MDIRELEIFLVVAEQLHFGRASRLCGLSPSALTRTIQRLEDQVERGLFVRDKRSVRLSAEGEQFLQYAREALHQWHAFKKNLRAEVEVSGNLSIYASLTAIYSILPGVLENYRQRYPQVQLELTTGAAEHALSLLHSGEIDLVVAALPTSKRAQLNILPLLTTPLVFIAPAQVDPAVDPRSAGQLDLSVAPLVLPQHGLARERVDQWFKSNRVVPHISSEVSGNEALIALVSLGGGIGVVPQLVWESSPLRTKVRVIHAAPQLEAYEVALCCNRQALQVPSVRAFWDLAQQRHELVTI